MAKSILTGSGKGGKDEERKERCERCHGSLQAEEMCWRLNFLAYVLSYLSQMGSPPNGEECAGLMLLLQDIANEIAPRG